jgi:acyl-CoA hydrolase
VVAENLKSGATVVTNTAFFTFVALDDAGKPANVPALIAQTLEEKFLFEKEEKQYRQRKCK